MASAAVHSLTHRRAAGGLPEHHGHHPLRGLVRLFRRWRARIRERRALALFEQRELSELGVSRWEVERELAKHFWEP